MPRHQSFVCTHCGLDRTFEYIHRRHRSFKDGHEDWHCITCGGCEYEPMRKRLDLAPHGVPVEAGATTMSQAASAR